MILVWPKSYTTESLGDRGYRGDSTALCSCVAFAKHDLPPKKHKTMRGVGFIRRRGLARGRRCQDPVLRPRSEKDAETDDIGLGLKLHEPSPPPYRSQDPKERTFAVRSGDGKLEDVALNETFKTSAPEVSVNVVYSQLPHFQSKCDETEHMVGHS